MKKWGFIRTLRRSTPTGLFVGARLLMCFSAVWLFPDRGVRKLQKRAVIILSECEDLHHDDDVSKKYVNITSLMRRAQINIIVEECSIRFFELCKRLFMV